jgi:hypothetical protein
LPCQALKGEPHERARLKNRGDRDGSKASKPAGTAGTQQDPEEATPGVVARRDWVALKGEQTSGEQKTPEDGVAAAGQDSEAGRKSEEGLTSHSHGSCPSPEDHEVDEPRGGIAKPMRRYGDGNSSRDHPTAREEDGSW